METEPSPPGQGAEPGRTHTHSVRTDKAITIPLIILFPMIITLITGLVWVGALVNTAKNKADIAGERASEANVLALDSEEIVREIRSQSERNEELITSGFRCLRGDQEVIVANQRLPIGPERSLLGNTFCDRFLETANNGE